MKYPIIIEQADGNLSAYCPDFPGCAGVGDTVEEAKESIIGAIEIQIEEMTADGLEIPQPTAIIDYFHLSTQAI